MKLNMVRNKLDLKDLFAQARAVHFAMRNGAITYQQAQSRTLPALTILNKKARLIAKKYGVTPKAITFQDLGRHL